MTVASNQSRKTFAGNGVTTSFATSPVVFFETDNLVVYVTDDTTGDSETLVENTDYTVSGGSGSTGTVNLAAGSSPYGAPTTDTTLVITRVLDITQETDFVNNDGSDAEVAEDALDRLTMVAQQHETSIGRTIHLPDSDVSGVDTTVPTPEANSIFGWNAAGTALINYVIQAGTSLVDLAASTGASLIGFIHSLTGAVLRTVQDRLRDTIYVTDFMTAAQIADVRAGTALVDVTAPIQAALNTLSASTDWTSILNPRIYFPKGRYKITSTLTTANSSSYFTLEGDGKFSSQLKWAGSAGSPMLKFTNCRSGVVRGLGFIGSASAKPSYGIQVNRAAGQVGSPASGYCRFESLFIGGSASDSLGSGIVYTADGGQDTNNEQGYFEDVEVYNVTSHGVSFEHSNSLEHVLVGCSFGNCLVSAINNYVVGALGGSFIAKGCKSGGCGTTLRVGGAEHALSVHGWQSEGDLKIVNTPANVASATLWLSIHGMDWKGEDGTAIVFDAINGNVLEFFGGQFSAASNLTISQPSSGHINIVGGHWGYSTISFNGRVTILGAVESAGSPTITNLGSGLIVRRHVQKPAVDSMSSAGASLSGTGPSIEARDNSGGAFFVNNGSPTNMSTLIGGSVGEVITLYFLNGNTTLVYGTGSLTLQLAEQANFTAPANSSITLVKLDSSASNRWKEISRTYHITSVSADAGDAAATLTFGSSSPTLRYNTAITADRAVALSTTGAVNHRDCKFRVVRTAAATGAFNVNVGTGPLKALAVGTWCDVEYNGSAWMLTAYGAL